MSAQRPISESATLEAPMNPAIARPGALDGITIMRYAHQYRARSAGGVEQYLRRINESLLHRHRMTIIQTHLVGPDCKHEVEVETVGIGRLIWVPIVIRRTTSILADLPWRLQYVLTDAFRHPREAGNGSSTTMLSFLGGLLDLSGGHFRYQTAIFSGHLRSLLSSTKVDLLAMHWLSYDTDRLISQSIRMGTPFVIVNHFGNERFCLPEARKWLNKATALAGVSSRHIPEEVRPRLVNLSDGVDTAFFSPDLAQPVRRADCHPVILLPARIDRGKGQRDLIEAARILASNDWEFVVVFAGAVDSDPFCRELKKRAAELGLGDRVVFAGEVDQKELRDWYAVSSVVVLPSQSEGLGRVLLEAQSMKKPVIAYDCGGTGEAVLHNSTGFLLKRGDVAGLAERIGFLLGHDAERLQMGECGRAFVAINFSLLSLTDRHERFYLQSLARRRLDQRPLSTIAAKGDAHHVAVRRNTVFGARHLLDDSAEIRGSQRRSS